MPLRRWPAFLLLLAAASCGKKDDDPWPPQPFQLSFAGVGEGIWDHGLFDPSLAWDPATSRTWMAFSEVLESPMWPGQNRFIRPRIAYSDDAGASWTCTAVLPFPALDVTLPLAPPDDAGTWVYEVSSLARDPAAAPAERWVLMSLRYLLVNGARHFEHGWIALTTAADPAGPWSAERKLFVGWLYDTSNDATIGPPEVQLDQLHADLNATAIFSEPGLYADATGIYVTMLAAEGLSTDGRIILVRWPPGGPAWEYLGSFLVNATDGPALACDGFSAPALYRKAGTMYLIATPQTADFYAGTRIFRITDLATATLERAAGVPVVVFSHSGTAASFNGAAAYVPEAANGGLLYSEAEVGAITVFKLIASRLNP